MGAEKYDCIFGFIFNDDDDKILKAYLNLLTNLFFNAAVTFG